jgi:uncharacterized protein YoaH (UPF0181 family)
MSPTTTQPAQPVVSMPSTQSCSSPAAAIFQAMKHLFAAEAQATDPASPKMSQLMDNYAQSLQLVTAERIANLLDNCTAEIQGTKDHLKLIRMMLQSLSTLERTMARISRERAVAQREAKRQAKEAKEQLQLDLAHKAIAKAQETLARIHNLKDVGISNGSAIETESKDARGPRENADSLIASASTLPLCHSATSPLPSQEARVPGEIAESTLAPLSDLPL